MLVLYFLKTITNNKKKNNTSYGTKQNLFIKAILMGVHGTFVFVEKLILDTPPVWSYGRWITEFKLLSW